MKHYKLRIQRSVEASWSVAQPGEKTKAAWMNLNFQRLNAVVDLELERGEPEALMDQKPGS